MADNILFSTKMKMMAFVILVAILPLVLLGFATDSVVDEYDTSVTVENAQNISDISSGRITNYFTLIRNLANSVAKSGDQAAPVLEYSEQRVSQMNAFLSLEHSIDAIIIMDQASNISKSAVWETGYTVPKLSAEAIENDIKYSNGISDFNEHTSKGNVVVSTYITNEKSERVGYVCVILDMSFLNGVISDEAIDPSTRLYVCDCAGNLLISEKTGIRPYADVDEFEDLGKQFDKITGGKLTRPYHYDADSSKKILMSSVIPETVDSAGLSWSVVSVVNKDILAAQYNNINSSLNSSILVISLIDIVLIIVFIIWFTRPISNAMRIMSGGEINLSSQRIIVNGNTEMDNINKQINGLLDALSESEQRYRTVVDMTDNIVFEYSVNKDTVSFSNNFNKKFSFRAVSLKYEDSFFVKANVYKEDAPAFAKFVIAMTEGQALQGEFRFKTIYNDYAWYLVRCASIRDSYNKIIKTVGVMLNIDKTKAREQQLMDKASLDPLTQAYNRESYELALLNEFDLSAMRNGKDAILFIDLDNFKHFNDEYNHTVGDEVLVFTVNLCKELLGKHGFVGRHGGDEFVLCFRETADMDAPTLAQKIISGLGAGFKSPSFGEQIVMYCSIGIAYLDSDTSDPAELIDMADNAMYSVKRSGKSNFAVYTDNNTNTLK